MPLLLLYEFLIIFFRYDKGNYTRNAADVWIKYVIQFLGVRGGIFAFGLLILALVIYGFVSMVRTKQDINPKFALYAIFESSAYAWILAFVASWLTSFVLVHLWIDEQTQFNLVLALGAGVYEELIFRAIGYGLLPYALMLLFRLPDLLKRPHRDKKSVTRNVSFELKIFAALLSSLLFAWVHQIGSFSLTDYTALYRFFMGLLFCLLYETRGLGIVVWTHSLYDVFVFLLT